MILATAVQADTIKCYSLEEIAPIIQIEIGTRKADLTYPVTFIQRGKAPQNLIGEGLADSTMIGLGLSNASGLAVGIDIEARPRADYPRLFSGRVEINGTPTDIGCQIVTAR